MSERLKAKERYFNQLVHDWAEADRECGRTYVLWQSACDRRERLAALKNSAYEELEAARSELSVPGQ
jgi:hypothetical protein